MNKILYIAPFCDGTGYSVAATETVRAMLTVGLDVVCRPVRFNNKNIQPQEWLKKLFEASAENCNICIQHVLPIHLDTSGGFDRIIPLFALETNELEPAWRKSLTRFKEIWAISTHMRKVIKRELPRTSVSVINHPIDISGFHGHYTPLDLVTKIKETTQSFIFYTIGEFVARKNYEGLLRAYLSEFSSFDNVYLVIKSSKDGLTAEESRGRMIELIEHVKRNLKLNYYPKIEIITERLSEQEINGLHSQCDCFIQPSHGEAFSLPAAHALAFGRTPIVSKCTGYLDYIVPSTGFLIDGKVVSCYGALDTFGELYTGRQTWFEPDILELREVMREAFNNEKNVLTHKRKRCIKAMEKLSHENIGKIIKEAIEHPS